MRFGLVDRSLEMEEWVECMVVGVGRNLVVGIEREVRHIDLVVELRREVAEEQGNHIQVVDKVAAAAGRKEAAVGEDIGLVDRMGVVVEVGIVREGVGRIDPVAVAVDTGLVGAHHIEAVDNLADHKEAVGEEGHHIYEIGMSVIV